jgi:hypothetical protein
MKFEELTVGRIVHYRHTTMTKCCAAIVIAREEDPSYVVLYVFVPPGEGAETITETISPERSDLWHDPRGCKGR